MKVLITGGTGSVGQELIKVFTQDQNNEITFTYFDNENLATSLSKQYKCKAISLKREFDLPNDFDIIVNNAGIINSLCSIENIDISKWNETLYVNLTLPFLIIKENLPHMKENKFGRIINISSIYGVCAEEDVCPYSVSKHGLIGLTRAVAKEYGAYGITCNAICPATINSSMSNRLADFYTNTPKERKEYFDLLINATPTKKLVEPIEVANFAYFISKSEALNINGAVLMLDGGYTA